MATPVLTFRTCRTGARVAGGHAPSAHGSRRGVAAVGEDVLGDLDPLARRRAPGRARAAPRRRRPLATAIRQLLKPGLHHALRTDAAGGLDACERRQQCVVGVECGAKRWLAEVLSGGRAHLRVSWTTRGLGGARASFVVTVTTPDRSGAAAVDSGVRMSTCACGDYALGPLIFVVAVRARPALPHHRSG